MRRTVTALALLFSLAACAGDGGWFTGGKASSRTPQAAQAPYAQPSSMMAGAPDTAGTTGGAGMISTSAAHLTATEQTFIIDAAQNGTAEVYLGRLAEQRGSTAAARDFGRTMVQDHTKANQDLMAIATRNGINPPTNLPPAAQAAYSRLQQASGTDFDAQYLELQGAQHLEQRAMLQFAAAHAQNADVRGFAQRTLPVVEQHIEMLRRVAPVAMR